MKTERSYYSQTFYPPKTVMKCFDIMERIGVIIKHGYDCWQFITDRDVFLITNHEGHYELSGRRKWSDIQKMRDINGNPLQYHIA